MEEGCTSKMSTNFAVELMSAFHSPAVDCGYVAIYKIVRGQRKMVLMFKCSGDSNEAYETSADWML